MDGDLVSDLRRGVREELLAVEKQVRKLMAERDQLDRDLDWFSRSKLDEDTIDLFRRERRARNEVEDERTASLSRIADLRDVEKTH